MLGYILKKAIKNLNNVTDLYLIGNKRYIKYLSPQELDDLPLNVHHFLLDDLIFQELKSRIEDFGVNIILVILLPPWVKGASRTEMFDWLMDLEMKGMYIIYFSMGIEIDEIDEKIENPLINLLLKVTTSDNTKMKYYNDYYFDKLTHNKGEYIIEDSNGSCIIFKVDKVYMENDFLDTNNRVIQIPAGEVFVVPQKGSVNGMLFIQEKFGMQCIVIKDDFADLSYIEKKLYLPVCEVGFGTNPQVPNIRNLPYIEKRYKTFHLGFGHNINFGGLYKYSNHFDIVSNSEVFNIKMHENNLNKIN